MADLTDDSLALRTDGDGKHTVDFNHHSPVMLEHSHEIYRELHERCPVAWTDQLGGYWVVSGYKEVQEASMADRTFSHENDHVTRFGVAQPPLPHWAGLVEMDPPEFTPLRKALVPWFSPKAATDRTEITRTITDYVIDQFIERGQCDLTADLAVPIPALLTMDLVGFPFAESTRWADLFHRHSYIPSGTPERDQLNAEVAEFSKLMHKRATERRANPTEDLLSYLATLEIDGAELTMEEIAGHAFLVLVGGINTTTSLLSNTFIHLQKHPEERARLLAADSRLLDSAFDEYMRHTSPVTGLARTVTHDCVLGGQQLKENDRVWLSWAAANLDESIFPEANTIRLDRSPNRHLGFGIGLHRCLGANIAKVSWTTVTQRVLERMPDYVLDLDAHQQFPDVGTGNGWLSTPVTFSPGTRLGVDLPHE
jgi:cytochrome P450